MGDQVWTERFAAAVVAQGCIRHGLSGQCAAVCRFLCLGILILDPEGSTACF
jgi:hypothetical protein